MIRKFKGSDKNALAQLWQTVFPNDAPHNEPEAMIRAKIAIDDLIFVAEEEGRLLGACMAGYDGHRGWLYAVAVSPDTRRKGTGSALVLHAIAALKELGCIKVNLQIRADNYQVEAFYQALGFVSEERISMGKLL